MSDWQPMICSHVWIDPEDPPIQRAPYSPWVGPHRREMKHGRRYQCRNCKAVIVAPKAPDPPREEPSR